MGWQPSSDPFSVPNEQMKFLPSARDVRDRAQADNLEWIIKQEGPCGKILVFAHRYHVSTTPVRVPPQEVMGTYLRRRLGERLVTIGNLIGTGAVECAGLSCGDGVTQTLERRDQESIEGLAGAVGAPRFLLDLRAAPAPVAHWLEQMHPLGQGRYDVLDVPVGRAFDVLFYLDVVTPARCGALS
jgi:erythromycin esterase-like protein